MYKKLLFIIFVGALILLGPKIIKSVLAMFEENSFNISGQWRITYTIYGETNRGRYHFGKTGSNSKGSVSYEGDTIGRYELMKGGVIFTMNFTDASRKELHAEFRGTIQDHERIVAEQDQMKGTLAGTRVVKGITVNTEGKWTAQRE